MKTSLFLWFDILSYYNKSDYLASLISWTYAMFHLINKMLSNTNLQNKDGDQLMLINSNRNSFLKPQMLFTLFGYKSIPGSSNFEF